MILLALLFLAIALVGLLFWKLVFLRNPERTIPEGNVVVSPADGKVIAIVPFTQNHADMFKGNHRILGKISTLTNDVAPSGYIVSIFMSPLDVHYNRAPIAGTITSINHSDGKLLPVNSLEAGLVNEKTEIVIAGKYVKVKMIQIAGFLARRIETFVKVKEAVNTGQIVGLINLGSQVTLVVPKSVMLKVTVGQKVIAGETIIAQINS